MNELLRLEHIQKIYGNGGGVTRAIDDISFSVSSGEFLGIMGASGSGKTTLLNCISTIDTVSHSAGGPGHHPAQTQGAGPVPPGKLRVYLSGLQPPGHPYRRGKHRPGPHHQQGPARPD